MPEQHNDHTWVTLDGEGWAIKAIMEIKGHRIFCLWRGYYPLIQETLVDVTTLHTAEYVRRCVELIHAAYPDVHIQESDHAQHLHTKH
jgi:hypothetical protein